MATDAAPLAPATLFADIIAVALQQQQLAELIDCGNKTVAAGPAEADRLK